MAVWGSPVVMAGSFHFLRFQVPLFKGIHWKNLEISSSFALTQAALRQLLRPHADLLHPARLSCPVVWCTGLCTLLTSHQTPVLLPEGLSWPGLGFERALSCPLMFPENSDSLPS